MTKWVQRSIGLLISCVSLFSVPRAGWLAFAIFARAPGRKPQNEKEAAVLRRAAPRLEEARQVRLLIEDTVVSAFDFRPKAVGEPKGTVLVVHGYWSRTEHMVPIIDALTAAGFQAVGLDLPGHGHSSGRRCHLINAVAAVDAAWREFDGFDAVIGHSFGAATAMAAAAGTVPAFVPRRPYKLVTIASPTRLSTIFRWFGKEMGLRPSVQAAFEAQVEVLSGKPLDAYDVAGDLRTLRIETLVMHAPDDKEVAWSNAERLSAAGPHVRLKPIAGYGHRRILAAPPMLDELIKFIARPTTGLDAIGMTQSPGLDRAGNDAGPEVRRSA